MKRLTALLLVLTLAGPAAAQEDENRFREGFDLFSEGTRLLLEGLADEMRPMLEEARPFFEDEMLPFLQSLGALIDDLAVYELPERLPNGDIIIRRIPDAPPIDPLPEVGENGDVEL